MLMTEKEASTKWCPHGRHADIGRDATANFNSRCVGTGCSQWRWYEREKEKVTAAEPPGKGWKMIGPSLADACEWSRVRPKRHGYCGLAGPVVVP